MLIYLYIYLLTISRKHFRTIFTLVYGLAFRNIFLTFQNFLFFIRFMYCVGFQALHCIFFFMERCFFSFVVVVFVVRENT